MGSCISQTLLCVYKEYDHIQYLQRTPTVKFYFTLRSCPCKWTDMPNVAVSESLYFLGVAERWASIHNHFWYRVSMVYWKNIILLYRGGEWNGIDFKTWPLIYVQSLPCDDASRRLASAGTENNLNCCQSLLGETHFFKCMFHAVQIIECKYTLFC